MLSSLSTMLSIQHEPQSCQDFLCWFLVQGKPSLWNSILEPEDNADDIEHFEDAPEPLTEAEQSNSDLATAGPQSAAASAQQAQHGQVESRDHSLDDDEEEEEGEEDAEGDSQEEGEEQEGTEEVEEDRNKASSQELLNLGTGQSQPADAYDMRKR